MSIANLKRLQKISHRVNYDQTELATEFISGLKASLAKRGYRADLSIATDARNTAGTFTASVRFDTSLGHPTEDDLVSLAASSYNTHEIDWELAEVDSDQGLILLSLKPSVEMIPIKSLNEIPPEFKPIGTGIYKRAVDSTVSEIWELKRGEEGLFMYRKNDDMEVKAEEEGFRAGDVVQTEAGLVGRIIRFDDMGNAFIQCGKRRHLVAAPDIKKYDQSKERSLLKSYYEMAYGDASFSEALTRPVEQYLKPTLPRKKKDSK
jgi:preprotein translocase subunit YajC